MPQPSLTRSRNDLSDFLRSRRARLSPDDVGLPNGMRRRAPGLRREEVASLAGVGLTWYTWFEQGRDIRVSPDFLENIARALRLSSAERQHLYVLTGREGGAARLPAREVSPALQRMLDGFVKYPAVIRTAHWDAIAWNKAANRLFGFAAMTPEVQAAHKAERDAKAEVHNARKSGKSLTALIVAWEAAKKALGIAKQNSKKAAPSPASGKDGAKAAPEAEKPAEAKPEASPFEGWHAQTQADRWLRHRQGGVYQAESTGAGTLPAVERYSLFGR